MKRFLLSMLAILLLVEEWLWDVLTRWGRILTEWLHLQRLERWLSLASPGVAMSAFLVPILAVIPVKLAGFWLIASGRLVAGLALWITAKLVVTLLVTRMFAVTRDQLLSFRWFAALYHTVTRWLSWAHARIRATAAYRQALRWKQELANRLAAWRQSA